MMRELRLIGVHDDGEHLVVTDDAGEEYRLRIDERLRAATRRGRPRQGRAEVLENVRPRDVQAMIRAGSTAEEVSARTGWPQEKITRFEGPVLAERAHVATRAQGVRMRGANLAGAPETLAQRAATRFATRDVAPAEVAWDACRDREGQWTVTAVFTAGGRERTATWWFDLAGMSVVAKDDEAKWLSEADTPSGPVPTQVHRPTAVFDVEVEEDRAEKASRPQPEDLIASMCEHSGAKSRGRGRRRRSRSTDPERVVGDELPLETDDLPPAARGTHPRDLPPEDAAQGAPRAEVTADEPDAEAPEIAATEPADSETGTDSETEPGTGPRPAEHEQESATPAETDAATSPEDTASAAADDETPAATEDTDPAPEQESETAKETGRSRRKVKDVDREPGTGKGRGRRGRASVPSWDDVMFGSKRD